MKRIGNLFAVLWMAVIFLASCGGTDDEKSKECDIESFTVSGKTWDINGSMITGTYPKGTNVSNFIPQITVSKGAKVSPESGKAQDFSVDVTYTVTAEDNKTTKSYTARAIVSTTP